MTDRLSAVPLILGSASPRRRDLLAQIGLQPARILPADIDESPLDQELPRKYALRMALEKARAVEALLQAEAGENPLHTGGYVSGGTPQRSLHTTGYVKPDPAQNSLHTSGYVSPETSTPPVLSADTVVAVGRRILPKAETTGQARNCLKLLSGRKHHVYGAIVLTRPGQKPLTRLVETTVTVKRLHPSEADQYLSGGEWQGKAGGYAIQGDFAKFIRQISGSYTNVVGLSLPDVYAMLNGTGLLATADAETDADA